MARSKNYCYEQDKMIPVSFREQILPGTFEFTLSYLNRFTLRGRAKVDAPWKLYSIRPACPEDTEWITALAPRPA